jgi:transcriptional regulator with XRE-family HTH domain
MPKRPARKNPEFGRRLKVARVSRGYNQGDIALALGTAQTYVSRWERGAVPSCEFVEQLAHFFGEDVNEWRALAGSSVEPAVARSRPEALIDAVQRLETKVDRILEVLEGQGDVWRPVWVRADSAVGAGSDA